MRRTFTYLIVFALLPGLVETSGANDWDPDTDPDLVAWWAFDETAGTTAYDSSGNGNDGTLQGDPEWVLGRIDGALQFNGTNAYVQAPHIPFDNRSFTIAMWVNPVLYTDQQIVFSQRQTSATDTDMHFRLGGPGGSAPVPGAVRMGFYSNDLDTAGGLIQDNDWYHITFWYDFASQDRRIYIDGVQEAQGTATAYLGTSGNTVVGSWAGSTQWFLGMIDDVRIYSRALSADEIKGLIPPQLKAFEPDPPDGAEGVTIPLLRWQGGETATWHDVYLGTTPDLGPADFVVRNQRAMTVYYHQPGLTAGTTYYWRIDEVEADGSTVYTGGVWSFSSPPSTAYDPIPCDGMKWIETDAEVRWAPGFDAGSHDVYFGTDEAAVADGTGDTSKGNQLDNRYSPDALAPDTTYYWRIDEIDNSGAKHPGQVWSFTTLGTVPPEAGLKGEYFLWPGGADAGPPTRQAAFSDLQLTRIDPTVDFNWGDPGSPDPLIPADDFSARWTGEIEIPTTGDYIFSTNTDDGVRVWIDNELVIENWTNHAPTVDMSDPMELTAGWHLIQMEWYERGGGAVAQLYWEGGCIERQIIPAVALSPPLRARNPRPANAAVDVKQTPTLRWDVGYKAAQHDVYFGTDVNAVADATTTSTGIYRGRQNTTTFNPASLEWDTTYYWRIDEVNTLDPESPWIGNVWGFTTADFFVVDDFEDYNDYTPDRIWQTWRDGYGYSDPAPGYDGNGSGSQVGNDDTPFTEQTIVHSGLQAMTFRYTNNGSTGKALYSEAEREWAAPQDWTVKGVKALTLWFNGDAANSAEPLYVGLQDSLGARKDVPHENTNAVRIGGWEEWNIDLQEFADAGVNLASIKKMYIGVGNRLAPQMGGTGTLYFDDIRVYKPRCFPSLAKPDAELSGDCVVDYADLQILLGEWLGTGYVVTPVQPSTTGLVAHYKFDDNTNDSSGNGLHGTAVGMPTYAAGKFGQAMSFDGVDDYVDCGNDTIFDITEQLTVAAWVNLRSVPGDWRAIIAKGDDAWRMATWGSAQTMNFAWTGSGRGYQSAGSTTALNFGEWYHVCGVYSTEDGGRIYINGVEEAFTADTLGVTTGTYPVYIGDNSQATGRYWDGLIDDVRICSRALPPGEVAGLAGLTEPFSAPFDFNADDTVDFADYAVLLDAWLDEVLWP